METQNNQELLDKSYDTVVETENEGNHKCVICGDDAFNEQSDFCSKECINKHEMRKFLDTKVRLGEIAINKELADRLSRKINFDEELEPFEKNLLTQLIRDNEIERVVRRKNLALKKDLKFKKNKHGRKAGIFHCEKCGEKLLPISYRTRDTIHRLQDKFYCRECDTILIQEQKLNETAFRSFSERIKDGEKIKTEKINILEGCTERTKRIIKFLVKEFGYSPMGFDVNLNKKLQQKDHQDIYYMGKHISNNSIMRMLESGDIK